jgi:hypothetical protein
MARKRKAPSSLATLTRARKQRRRRNPSPAPRANAALVGNPPIWQDMYEIIAPGLIAYTGVRLAGRIAFKVGKRKSLAWGRHLGPWASVLAALGAWWAVHKIPKLERFHTPVVVGGFIAAIQGILQTYLPQYGWIMNDYHLDDPMPRLAASAGSPAAANGRANGAQATGQYLEAEERTLDDLADVLNDGETADDLYTGSFAR